MSNPLTDFRSALQEQFARDLEITVVPGYLEGPVQLSDLGSCYVQRLYEMPQRVMEEEILVQLRVFKQFQPLSDPAVPYDVTPLEEIAAAIQRSIVAHQTGLPGTWFQRVTAIEIDAAKQGVYATVLATANNAGLA
jgi:hypothetical protein